MLYAEHIERTGVKFLRLACEQDLEGIVAKAKHSAYGEKWFKIRNPRYSQYEAGGSCLRDALAHHLPAEMAMAMTKY